MTKRFIWSKQNYFVNNNQNAISMIFEDENKIYLPDAKNQQKQFFNKVTIRPCLLKELNWLQTSTVETEPSRLKSEKFFGIREVFWWWWNLA